MALLGHHVHAVEAVHCLMPMKLRSPSKTTTLAPTVPATVTVATDKVDTATPVLMDTLLERCRAGYAKDVWFTNLMNIADLRKTPDGLFHKHTKVVVPTVDSLHIDILRAVHDTPYAGHTGIQRTYELVSRLFWWPTMRKDVTTFVTTCHTCQRNKSSHRAPAGQLQSLDIPDRPWDSVSMDFITQLPLTKNGNTQIMVFVDRLTKMVHLAALPTNTSTLDVAHCFMHNVFRLHGLPSSLVMDRDPKFSGTVWQAIMKLLGAKVNMSTAYHPQSDGQTERANQVLEDMLRHFVNPSQDNWDELLDCAEFAINNGISQSTQDTPFRLNYGQDPNTPLSIEMATKVPAAKDFVMSLQSALKRAKDAFVMAQNRQKHAYDAGRRPQDFGVGQQVLLQSKNFTFKGSLSRKLMPKWIGPFAVV